MIVGAILRQRAAHPHRCQPALGPHLLAFRPRGRGFRAAQPFHPSADPARAWFGLGALGALMVLIVGLGVFPDPVIAAGQAAAGDLVDPQRYLQAVFELVPRP